MKDPDGRYAEAARRAWAEPGARAKRCAAMRSPEAQAKRAAAANDPSRLRERAAQLLARAAELEREAHRGLEW
jgi:hypothetical protein